MTDRTRTHPATALLLVMLALTGCTSTSAAPPATAQPASQPAPPPPSPTPSPTGPPAFVGTVEVLGPEARQRMTGVSWRAGCPVGLDDLRLLRLSYVDFDGNAQVGELVVHHSIADATVRVFGTIYTARFPIRSMRTIEAYDGSDDKSMAADNTSGFNCRNVPNTTKWSNHAYGRAIDMNTVENPYLPGNQVMPPAGKAYIDRKNVRPGMIVAGDPVVTAFRAEGFIWGGTWRNGVDYQHFEKPR